MQRLVWVPRTETRRVIKKLERFSGLAVGMFGDGWGLADGWATVGGIGR